MILNLKASENLKVEPPNWWTHFDDRKLELMVYKEKIGNSKILKILDSNKEVCNSIKIIDLKKTDNENYLFIKLLLMNDLKPGTYTFNLNGPLTQNSFNYTFHSPEKERYYANGFNSSDVIYLLMPDRFSNGDSNNDFIQGLRAGTDRTKPGLRHGGD